VNFVKKLALAAAGIAACAAPVVVGMMNARAVQAQSPAATKAKFEVAAIRPCGGGSAGPGAAKGNGGGSGRRNSVSPGRLNLSCVTVADLIRRAYLTSWSTRLMPKLSPISGGSPWIDSDRYDINAKAEDNASSETMQGAMLQALLEDRFRLRMHRETKEVPVYALTAVKSGPKLQPFQEESCAPTNQDAALPVSPPAPDQKPNCSQAIVRNGSNLVLVAQGATVDEFSQLLAVVFNRPVINKTGIVGRFNFRAEYAPDQATPGLSGDASPTSADGTSGPSIFTAVQELGLRIDSTKGPGEFLVIDSVERPSEN
jgi:uncharacterized protein (TIGR03435 family)